MSYPNSDELQAFCLNAGIIKAGEDLTLDYGNVLKSAIKRWEQDSGWQPFIAVTQTRLYDYPLPDGKILDLRCGALSVDSFTISGTALTEGVDYILYPLNAQHKGWPYQWIEFVRPYSQNWPYQLPATLSITGTFGYAAECPVEVRQAILSLAACNLIATKSGAATGAITGIRQDDVQINYANPNASSGMTPQQAQLMDAYKETLKQFKRTVVF